MNPNSFWNLLRRSGFCAVCAWVHLLFMRKARLFAGKTPQAKWWAVVTKFRRNTQAAAPKSSDKAGNVRKSGESTEEIAKRKAQEQEQAQAKAEETKRLTEQKTPGFRVNQHLQ